MSKRRVKLDQGEIIRLGTPKKPLSTIDKIMLYLLKNDTGISLKQLAFGMNRIFGTGHLPALVQTAEHRGLVIKQDCKCGNLNSLIFPTLKGIKYARSLQ